jgi:hypothetical protein
MTASASSWDINKTRQPDWGIEQSAKTREVAWFNVPTLTVIMSTAAIDRTNICSKTH